MVYAKRIDFTDKRFIYKAEAAAGSSNSAAVWRIRRITLGSTLSEKWAEGEPAFNNAWDDRLILIYT